MSDMFEIIDWYTGFIASGIAEAMREIIADLAIAGTVALITHMTLGAWIKWRYSFQSSSHRPSPCYYHAVVISHLLFGLAFLNPYFLLWLDSLIPEYGHVVDFTWYWLSLWGLGLAFDLILLRLLPRVPGFRWMAAGPLDWRWAWVSAGNVSLLLAVLSGVVWLMVD